MLHAVAWQWSTSCWLLLPRISGHGKSEPKEDKLRVYVDHWEVRQGSPLATASSHPTHYLPIQPLSPPRLP
jgi:hypothetical protein